MNISICLAFSRASYSLLGFALQNHSGHSFWHCEQREHLAKLPHDENVVEPPPASVLVDETKGVEVLAPVGPICNFWLVTYPLKTGVKTGPMNVEIVYAAIGLNPNFVSILLEEK